MSAYTINVQVMHPRLLADYFCYTLEYGKLVSSHNPLQKAKDGQTCPLQANCIVAGSTYSDLSFSERQIGSPQEGASLLEDSSKLDCSPLRNLLDAWMSFWASPVLLFTDPPSTCPSIPGVTETSSLPLPACSLGGVKQEP